MEQMIAVIVGGFLAAGSGWFLNWRQEQERVLRIRKLLTTGICDDLRHASALYEKIIEDWGKTGTVWFATLTEFRESRYIYQNNKDWVILFTDIHLRKAIFRYYLQSAESINNLEYQQHRKYEIGKQLNEMARELMTLDRTLIQEQALKIALERMGNESREYSGLDQSIPILINKLKEHKATAENLLGKLGDKSL